MLAILGGFAATCAFSLARLRSDDVLAVYTFFRRGVARSLILGLEFLIAGDIIRTVTVDQTFESAAVLAVIVIIRVLLAITLEADIEERWPWQARSPSPEPPR